MMEARSTSNEPAATMKAFTLRDILPERLEEPSLARDYEGHARSIDVRFQLNRTVSLLFGFRRRFLSLLLPGAS